MKSTIHVVYACTNYEGDTAIRAFTVKHDANTFKAKCYAHEAKRPVAPDDSSSEAEHEKWWTKHQRWAKKHPAGADRSSHDDFQVRELALFRATPESGK